MNLGERTVGSKSILSIGSNNYFICFNFFQNTFLLSLNISFEVRVYIEEMETNFFIYFNIFF